MYNGQPGEIAVWYPRGWLRSTLKVAEVFLVQYSRRLECITQLRGDLPIDKLDGTSSKLEEWTMDKQDSSWDPVICFHVWSDYKSPKIVKSSPRWWAESYSKQHVNDTANQIQQLRRRLRRGSIDQSSGGNRNSGTLPCRNEAIHRSFSYDTSYPSLVPSLIWIS